ncbi:PLDc N-terminal domain-containing protein [Fulvivirga sediminis]|uniref:PLDc N-terminal domain-containing protein n=1 Tax=Fulvivirga sediminis TaxID=2803949 RepID=A0A937F9U9_9BACT|nr:PLDc N-terminal domain-containing protein [Fulvivirga sediminis]MBL3656944.1 PLDc N-terminal domain-containing protein [Fulvivirga sediminis]
MGGILYLIGLICAIWVIYDVWVVNKSMDETTKVLWTILAVIANFLTAIIYYFIHKKRAV